MNKDYVKVLIEMSIFVVSAWIQNIRLGYGNGMNGEK